MELCKDMGLDEDFYSVSIPLGATINMEGAAITITVMAMSVAYTFKFRSVKPYTLCNLVNRSASVFTVQKNININAFTGVDEGGHPSGADLIWVSVSFDIQEGVVETVHNDVIAVH